MLYRLYMRSNIEVSLVNGDDNNNNGMYSVYVCFGKGYGVKSSDRL